MKIHTTNYTNTFIQIADDCPVSEGQAPPVKEDSRTVASIQFDLIRKNPYKYTSDDIVFGTYAEKKDLTTDELEAERIQFFSKGQPCLRASPLTKKYGWGLHHDKNGKVALYGVETAAYKQLSVDPALQLVKAMRSKKA